MLSSLRRALLPASSVAEAVATQARMYHENVRIKLNLRAFFVFLLVWMGLHVLGAPYSAPHHL